VGEAYKFMPGSFKEQSTWMCIKIQGPMEHSTLLQTSPSCTNVHSYKLLRRSNGCYGFSNRALESCQSSGFCSVNMVCDESGSVEMLDKFSK